MRSRTSFFNPTVFWKTVKRFWPLWAGYLAFWVLILPLSILSDRMDYYRSALSVTSLILNSGVYGSVIGGGPMAVVTAMAVWSFLYSARSAHGMACLPLRRECLWCSAMLGGLAPVLAVHALVALLTGLAGAVTGTAAEPALQWFGLMSLNYLFFYGFACLCAQLTGNIIILPVLYGVLNFLAVGVDLLIRGVFAQFVYGLDPVNLGLASRYLSPAVAMVTEVQAEAVYADHAVTGYRVTGWEIPWIYAAVGLVLLAGSLLLFRRRRMESAGDVVAVPALKPVFRWCMALGCGLVLSSLLYAIFWYSNGLTAYAKSGAFLFTLVFLLVGAFLGWFIAEMLLRKSFRVFRGGRWRGLGLVCLVILAAMLGMRFDLFGVERRVPAASQVVQAEVRSNGGAALLKTEEGVEQVRALHQAILADRGYNEGDNYDESWGSMYCYITYQLKNGAWVRRNYELRYPMDDPRSRGETGLVQDLMNSPEAVAERKRDSQDITRDRVLGGMVDLTLTANECAALAGYEDPEEYVLESWYGMDRAEIAALSPEDRRGFVVNAAWNSGYNLSKGSRYAMFDYTGEAQRISFEEDVDYDMIWLDYQLNLSAAEAWELYETAMAPDLAEGKLGRIYILNDDSYATGTYLAELTLELKAPPREKTNTAVTLEGQDIVTFRTTATVDAVRTADWLEEHGAILHTPAELEG